MSALGGGLNRSAQHSNLLAKMECEHEAATLLLLLGRSKCTAQRTSPAAGDDVYAIQYSSDTVFEFAGPPFAKR
jgi:hypothetical protein